MAERQDTSKSSSNTSTGDSEPIQKKPNTNISESPRQGTLKTVINVIPADDSTISPKRDRYKDVQEDDLTISKKSHSENFGINNNLAPPPTERPSITISSADTIRPVTLFSSPAEKKSSFIESSLQNSTIFSSPNQNSVSTSQTKTLFQNGFTTSLGQFNTTSLFSGQSNSASSSLKYSQKCEILFGNSSQNLQNLSNFKSEEEKIKVLFSPGVFEPKPGNFPHLDKAFKDPQGLEFLQNEINSKTETKKQEKKVFRFEEVKLKKKDEKNPFELILKSEKNSEVFKKSKKSSEFNLPCVSIEFVLKEQVGLKRNREKLLFLRPGYETCPSLEILNKLNEEKLAEIKGFSLKNEFGIIRFEGPVNLNEVDLVNDVLIEKGKISAYSGKELPKIGTGINVPAVVSLFDCFPNKPIPVSDFVDVLTELCRIFESKFLSWDKKTGKWVFRIRSFQNFHNV